MTDPRMYILVGIPIVGILSNAALWIHLSSSMEARFVCIEMRMQMILDKISDLDNRLSVLLDPATY